MTLQVLSAGPRSLIEDLGRPGFGAMGVSQSGAFDRRALRQGNAMLGNEPDCAGIEVLGGGLRLLAGADHLLALTGAPAAARLDGRPAAAGRVLSLRRGQQLALGNPGAGLRSYVTVAGGLDVPRQLGSASSDTLSGLGPAPLAAGDRLSVGPRRGRTSHEDVPALIATGELAIGVILGPREDWFTAAALRLFLDTGWLVGTASDRIGIRLDGPAPARAIDAELPSEPCLRGSIQVTATGQPIVLGPDHPVTGGYPVIAVVRDRDTDLLGQARPGDVIRFIR